MRHTELKSGPIKPITALVLGTVLLLATIIGTNLFVLGNLREASLKEAQSSLAKYSTTLAEHADRSFKSLELVLTGVEEHVLRQGVHDSASYEMLMASLETYHFLKERFSGLPQVDAITLIRADGKLINFSRYWPIPEVNISDRDYYKALKADPNLKSFISQPVPNRGTGTSTIYMARRLSGPGGEFIGLVLGAMTLSSFEDFFARTLPGDGSAVSLIREDGMLLARYPRTDHIGKLFPQVGRANADQKSVITRGESPIDSQVRIKSTSYLSNYPLLILATQTEASALREWYQMFSLFALVTAVATGIVVLCAFVIARWWLQQANLARVRNEKARAEHAKAVAEADLLRARESAAEAASRAKSSFLAVMSHEIRTPMNAVLGYASSLLEESSLQPDQRKAIGAIHEAGDNLLEILNDILDYSKLEAGLLVLENVAFSPQSVIESALSIMAPKAKAKGLNLRSERDAALPKALSGDVGRLRQVLLNLVANAVKFTETGGVSISARCLNRTADAATVEWSVSDSGIGIDPDRIGTLFREFVQADCTINRRFGGSGLGLSICKRILDQMDGQITAVSTLGQGTTVRFSVTLPVAEVVEESDSRGDDPATELRKCLADLKRPLRVLITDDNPTNRLVASKMLEEFAVQVSMACDGLEAVAAVAQFSYDVVLMDMRMPEMDGLQATRAIRAQSSSRQVPIIAFTANAFPDDVQACTQAGMNGFVVKPVRKKLLLDAVLTVLKAKDQVGDGCSAQGVPNESIDPTLDSLALDRLAEEIGADTMHEAVAQFVVETADRIQNLKQLSVTAQADLVGREAHSLKGTAGTFGLMRLAALGRRLESVATSISDSDYQALVGSIDREFALACNELRHPQALAA